MFKKEALNMALQLWKRAALPFVSGMVLKKLWFNPSKV